MAAFLTIRNAEQQHNLTCHAVITIGRDKNSDIKIDDREVSRQHAMIRRLGNGEYYLIDSGSINGSRINNKRITTPTQLTNGAVITVGTTKITFCHDCETQPDSVADGDESTLYNDDVDIQKITILVADIRGFTTLSEEIPIATLTKIMTEWFRHVSDLVSVNEGVVDKFIGDCVYARWHTSDDSSNSMLSVLNTVMAIKKITDNLSHIYLQLPRKLTIGVGINTGQASIGIGSDNTAIGDEVNLAFRLESASKQLGQDIVLSHSSYQQLPEKFYFQREKYVTVKGKKKPIKICATTFSELELFLADYTKHNNTPF